MLCHKLIGTLQCLDCSPAAILTVMELGHQQM